MIHIEANGGLRKERKLAKDVMWFCLEMLMPRMRNLTIELEFTNTLDEGAMGFAFMGEDRKDLIIEIDHKLGRDEGHDKLIEARDSKPELIKYLDSIEQPFPDQIKGFDEWLVNLTAD